MSETASGLQELLRTLQAQAGGARAAPPVELWNPQRCTDEGNFEIRADGTWRHDGAIIGREALVRLFATILRKDADGETYLVTPGEKVRVRVADAPFLAIRADRTGAGPAQSIVFTTNVGDVTPLDGDHPLRIAAGPRPDEPRPYVLVRGRLDARILRAPYYDLAAWGETHAGVFGVWSAGAFFPLEQAAP